MVSRRRALSELVSGHVGYEARLRMKDLLRGGHTLVLQGGKTMKLSVWE